MTIARQNAMQQVYNLAKQKGISVDKVITTVLTNSIGNVRAYIQHMGETPVKDPVGQAVQAILLRASQIATTANSLGVSDGEALKTIEGVEQDAVTQNSPEKDNVLPVPIQGAIACALQYMHDQSGGKSMTTILKATHTLAKNPQLLASNDDGLDMSMVNDPTDLTDFSSDGSGISDPVQTGAVDAGPDLSQTSVSSALASIPVSGTGISVAAGIPTIAGQASQAAQVGGGSDTTAGGVLNTITGIFNSITSAANSISTAARSTTGAVGSVKNALSGVGASSISQYVQNNLPIIIILIVAIVLIIVYARRK